VTSPSVSAADREHLVGGNSMFAFDLYQYFKDEAGEANLFYSPFSISVALAMTYSGARGGTEQQMADTLHFTLPQAQLHPAFNWLDLALASRGEGAKGKDDQGFRLNIVNAIWGQSGYKFLDTFLDALAVNYGAGLRLLDFASDSEASRLTINDWVSDQTEGRIEDLIPQGLINPVTRLVLTNAIYFNAAWAEPFKESQTKDGAFHLLDGVQVTVPMMWHSASYGYAKGGDYQAVELPYDGHELSMVILLPEAVFGQHRYETVVDEAR
jgi:serpin B